jgi:hypothetical protein
MPEPIPALTGLPSPVARGPDISNQGLLARRFQPANGKQVP